MKPIVVFPLLLLAAVTATILHKIKNKTQGNDIANMAAGLNGIEKVMLQNANVTYRPVNINTDVYLWARYLLAPRYLSINYKEKFDTVLTIWPAGSADTVSAGIMTGRKVLWQNQDNRYNYILTCKP